MLLLAQTAGLCRGRGMLVFNSTRGQEWPRCRERKTQGAEGVKQLDFRHGMRGKRGRGYVHSHCSSRITLGLGGRCHFSNLITALPVCSLLGSRAEAWSWSHAAGPSAKDRAFQPQPRASPSPWQSGQTSRVRREGPSSCRAGSGLLLHGKKMSSTACMAVAIYSSCCDSSSAFCIKVILFALIGAFKLQNS